jgi:peptidoglycan/LPS O-acetylase OafA/YrhL
MNPVSPKPVAPLARFPGLDGLRTILAILVVCSHIEDFKVYFPSFPKLGIPSYLGTVSVQCFFVLSGFLITYLLLQEQDKTGRINIRQFYGKRILRIWPLYVTITALGFFVLPSLLNMADFPGTMQSFDGKIFLYYLVILPNLAIIFHPLVLGASQLWSIGIEEQFYLFWPWVVRACRRSLPFIILGCIFGKPLLGSLSESVVGRLIQHGFIENDQTKTLLTNALLIWRLLPIECLASGSLFAYLVHTRNPFCERWLGHPVSQATSWLALLIWHWIPIPRLYGSNFHLATAGILFGLAVWNIGANQRTFIGLRARWLNSLGALTYSIYMWHLIVLVAVFKIANAVELPAKLSLGMFHVVLYMSVIGLTVLMAKLSYSYLEMPFLELKDRWFGKQHEIHQKSLLSTLASITSAPHTKLAGQDSKEHQSTKNRTAA